MTALGTGDWALMIASLGMAVITGAGVFQALFVMPEYFSDPPKSLARYQRDKSFRFWLPLHALTLPALVTSLVTG
jgi:hypothetical protein